MTSVSGKPGNGNEKNSANAAKKAATSAADDIQDDFESLREDVQRLTQQLARFAAAKGNEALSLANENLEDALDGVRSRGRDAAEAVGEVRDNLANAINESLERRPYTTLALALAFGFVAGAVWKR